MLSVTFTATDGSWEIQQFVIKWKNPLRLIVPSAVRTGGGGKLLFQELIMFMNRNEWISDFTQKTTFITLLLFHLLLLISSFTSRPLGSSSFHLSLLHSFSHHSSFLLSFPLLIFHLLVSFLFLISSFIPVSLPFFHLNLYKRTFICAVKLIRMEEICNKVFDWHLRKVRYW